MTERRPKTVHFDASPQGAEIRTSLCGWSSATARHFQADTDLTRVTCKLCLARRIARPHKAAQKPGRPVSEREVAEAAAEGFKALLGAKAGPPPRYTPATWALVCKGVRRCGNCAACEHERDLERWEAVSPWNRLHRPRDKTRPKWGTLYTALRALAEYEGHGRAQPSASGPTLDRCRLGLIGSTGGSGRHEDPSHARADEVDPVRKAVLYAFPDSLDDYALTPEQCRDLLMWRTPGVLEKVPEYPDLSAKLGCGEDELKRIAMRGRAMAGAYLYVRGLMPMPRVPSDRFLEEVNRLSGAKESVASAV